MKKLLNVLAAISFVSTFSATTVACAQGQYASPLKIGTKIQKQSNAVKYSENKTSESGYSNYFILGDSLSDVDGLTGIINNKFKNLNISIPGGIDVMPGVNISSVTGKIMPGLNFSNDIKADPEGIAGYGYEENGEYRLAFSNGPTAGYILDNKLGTNNTGKDGTKQQMLAANKNITPTAQTRNYSIGGATAAKVPGLIGDLILNGATIDKQAENLIAQHHVETTKNDLVFLEIGGNDLFALVDNHYNDRKAQVKLLDEAMNRIRIAMFTLLNNGIEEIIVATPPDVSVVPKYQHILNPKSPTYNKKKADYIRSISKEFNKRMISEIKSIEKYYPEKVHLYDIYSEFDGLQTRHQDYYRKVTGNNAFVTIKNEAFANTQEIEIKDLQLRVNINALGVTAGYIQVNINDYVLTGGVEQDPKDHIKFSYKLPKLPGSISKEGTSLVEAKKDFAEIAPKLSLISIQAFITNTTDKPAKQGKDADIRVKMYRPSSKIEVDRPIDSYFFTDFVHPTKVVHQLVAEDLYKIVKK